LYSAWAGNDQQKVRIKAISKTLANALPLGIGKLRKIGFWLFTRYTSYNCRGMAFMSL
jgi:hypothetical protein